MTLVTYPAFIVFLQWDPSGVRPNILSLRTLFSVVELDRLDDFAGSIEHADLTFGNAIQI